MVHSLNNKIPVQPEGNSIKLCHRRRFISSDSFVFFLRVYLFSSMPIRPISATFIFTDRSFYDYVQKTFAANTNLFSSMLISFSPLICVSFTKQRVCSATDTFYRVSNRGGVLEDVLGLEDTF